MIWPFSLLKRGSVEANRSGRRWADDGQRKKFNALESQANLVRRAEHFSLNNPHGSKIVQALVQNIIGTGIVPRSFHPSATVKEKLRTNWSATIDRIDEEGLQDFYGLQQSAFHDVVVYGEAFLSLGSEIRTGEPRLQRLHPDQVDRSYTANLADGYIIQGVEFDKRGRRRAFHIRENATPHDLAAGIWGSRLRVSAASIIHIFRPLVPGQVRGLSWFAPILLPADELAQLIDAVLVRAKVSAMYVGSITDIDGKGPGFDGEQVGTVLDTTVSPGSIRVEEPGKELRWSAPPEAGDAPALGTEILRMIATGSNTTYEQLTGDYSKVTYSSARAAILEFRRFCEGIQHHTMVFQFCRPVWQAFIRYQVLSGVIPATAYTADRTAFEKAKWLPPAWQWVDPLKDTNAAVVAMKNRIRSRADIIAEQGLDVEDVDREISADSFLKETQNAA